MGSYVEGIGGENVRGKKTFGIFVSDSGDEFVLRDLKYVTTPSRWDHLGSFQSVILKVKVEFLEGVYQNHSDRDLERRIFQHRN